MPREAETRVSDLALPAVVRARRRSSREKIIKGVAVYLWGEEGAGGELNVSFRFLLRFAFCLVISMD